MHDKAKEHDALCLISTTIEENKSMLRIFASQDYSIQAQVYGWPSGNVVRQLRASKKTLAESILHDIDTDISNEGGPGSLRWDMCTCTQKLSHAIKVLRAQGDELENVATEHLWLPSEYAAVGATGTDAQTAVGNGCVWIASDACNEADGCLGQSSETNDSPSSSVVDTPRAILFKTNGYLGGELVGIMASNARIARCAMHFALSRFPKTEKIYLDPCNSTFIPAKEIGYSITPDGGTENPEWHSYLVLTKLVLY